MSFSNIFPPTYDYGENKALSQPFKFIGLPLYSVLLFILYWLIYCPLLFVKIQHHYLVHARDWPTAWPYYFWIVALIVFLILLSILVVLWKRPSRNKKSLFEVDYIDPKASAQDDEKKSLMEIEDTKSVTFEEKQTDTEGKRKRPTDLAIELKETKTDENPRSSLSPRELFFHDLIESANKSFNSSITLNDNRKSENDETSQEFFIASVSPSKTCVTNVFMFVNPEDTQEIAKDVQYM